MCKRGTEPSLIRIRIQRWRLLAGEILTKKTPLVIGRDPFLPLPLRQAVLPADADADASALADDAAKDAAVAEPFNVLVPDNKVEVRTLGHSALVNIAVHTSVMRPASPAVPGQCRAVRETGCASWQGSAGCVRLQRSLCQHATSTIQHARIGGCVSGCSDRAVDESPVGLLWQDSFVALSTTLSTTLSTLYHCGVAWLGVHSLHSGVMCFSVAHYRRSCHLLWHPCE
jgi:hypothetical protein